MGLAIELQCFAQTSISKLRRVGSLPSDCLIQSAIEIPPDRQAVGRRQHWSLLAQFSLPFLLSLAQFVVPVLEGFLGILESEIGLHEPGSLIGRRHRQARWRVVGTNAIEPLFRHVVEERVEPVKFLGANGIVLVVVALGAAHGQPHKGGPHGVDPIHHVLVEVLVRIGAALVIGHVVAHEASGHPLTDGRIGQEIARQLLDGELIEGLVGIEGIDHPVPP